LSGIRQSKIYKCQLALTGGKGLITSENGETFKPSWLNDGLK